MPLTKIGPYRILRRLKGGGVGTVYLAADLRLNRRVAVKLVAVPRDQETRGKVIAEARALASVNHRTVVQIFDIVEVKDYIALVMEYVPGLDLEEVLEQSDVDVTTALYLGLDICAALAAAHAAGLVHGDLKPANVLLDTCGRARLIDFGIANAVSGTARPANAAAAVVAGSYSCISPEQASGMTVGPRADLFAVGVFLYRLLSGEHPFAGEDGSDRLAAVRSRPHKSLADENENIPQALSEFVDQLLAKEPQARPSSALAARQQIMMILRDLPVVRKQPLVSLIEALSVPDKASGALVELPARFALGARSRLLTEIDWGPWTIGLRSALPRSALVVVATFVLSGVMYVSNEWWQVRNQGVGLRPPIIRVSEGTGLAPQQSQLMGFLQSAVEDQPRWRVREGPQATSLLMQVQCNPHLCGVVLTRTDSTGSRASYQALMPGAAQQLWREGVYRGVEELLGRTSAMSQN